jgi:hypothetical protein
VTNRIFLIAHSDSVGKGSAQAEIPAADRAEARRVFLGRYPERRITVIGIKGMADSADGLGRR